MTPFQIMMLKLWCMQFLLITASQTQAARASDMDTDLHFQQVVNALYQFKFADADSLIAELEIKYPEHYIPALARAHFYWWKMISQHPESQIESRYIDNLRTAEQLINNKSTSGFNDKVLFHLIQVHAYLSRLDLMRSEYVSAYRNLHRSVKHIKASFGREQFFTAFLLTSGLYNYLAAYVSEHHPLLRIYFMLHPRGDINKGIEQLQQASASDHNVIATEAKYFLMRIFFDLENNPGKAIEYASILTEQYPENLIFLYYHHKIAAALQASDKVARLQQQYDEALKSNSQLNDFQVKYLEGIMGL